ncbi:MAG: molybdopterin-synthase adenylyltransferase MoeB [Candidatus Omnitrophica bacterium]|nr:molybdopterin-synthase adenylyltransferase MoeB [Candidatus Omnitrophota bacterium]
MSRYTELLQAVRARVPRVDPEEARARLDAGALFLDVREPGETSQGTVPGAVCIPRGTLEGGIESRVPDRDREIVVYCAGGGRSAFAVESLQQLGYRNVTSMDGGFDAWKTRGYPWSVDREAGRLAAARYSRHLLVPEVGESGQRKLFEARVLVLGAGGLGSPAAIYLAAAGVGHLGIVDPDAVDESNLQRQILHGTADIGRPKVESAAEHVRSLNPDVEVTRIPLRLDSSNAMEVLAGWDIVVNGCDNFPTRYLVNDACFFLGKPLVDGSIFRFEGQVTVFHPKGGANRPCYRCLFPTPPPPELAPNCAEAGVLGVLPGMVGTMQANEAIKLIIGAGQPLFGRLLVFDALTMEFRDIRLGRDPNCSLCGARPTVTALIDYEDFCRGHVLSE